MCRRGESSWIRDLRKLIRTALVALYFAAAEFLLSSSLPVGSFKNWIYGFLFKGEERGKNNKSKLMRYSLYYWHLFFFLPASLLHLKGENKEWCCMRKMKTDHLLKRREGGNQKGELKIPWTCATPAIFKPDNCTETQRGSDLIGIVLAPSQTCKKSTSVIFAQAVCNTCPSQHRRRLAATGGRKALTCSPPLLVLPSLQGENRHNSPSLQEELLAQYLVN